MDDSSASCLACPLHAMALVKQRVDTTEQRGGQTTRVVRRLAEADARVADDIHP